jgi:fermentation-respiration switch protein FrsA (DUF1100 family)
MRWVLLIVAVLPAIGGQLRPGRNAAPLRGQEQHIYFIPAKGQIRGKVMFLPGDGGWRGFAIDVAGWLSGQGYDVFGVDTNRYLTSFTGARTLTEHEMMLDMTELGRRYGDGQPILLVGWSQGAGMAVLAGASSGSSQIFSGIVAIGLPLKAVLGWRAIDDLTWITKKNPDEPEFSVRPWLEKTAGLPLLLMQSKKDEYTTAAEAESLFVSAAEPKKLVWVEAADHKFSNNRLAFFENLRKGLDWLEKAAAIS